MRSHLPFLIILVLALVIRFYNFPVWQGFDYDQEVNAWLAKSVIVDHKPILIGPETSVGGMYVGPYFNYIISLFYFLGRMDHSRTIILNALLTLLTITTIYFVGTKIFSKTAGLVAATIYAFSAFFIFYDRVMWNPTIIPLVAVSSFYAIYVYLRERKTKQLILATALVGFMFHVHFSAVFLLAFFALSLAIFGGRRFWANPWNYLFVAITLGIFLLPLVIFDLRHNFINSSHLIAFFVSGKTGGSLDLSIVISLWNVLVTWGGFVGSVILNQQGARLDWVGLAGMLAVLTLGLQRGERTLFYRLLLLLLFVTTVGLSVYHGPLPPYYFLIPLPILVMATGDMAQWVMGCQQMAKPILSAALLIMVVANIKTSLDFPPSEFSLRFKQGAVKYIIADARGQSFKVDFITELGLNTGFHYLFWQQGENLITDMTIPTARTYKIIIPFTLAHPEELAIKFGAIGVVKM